MDLIKVQIKPQHAIYVYSDNSKTVNFIAVNHNKFCYYDANDNSFYKRGVILKEFVCENRMIKSTNENGGEIWRKIKGFPILPGSMLSFGDIKYYKKQIN